MAGIENADSALRVEERPLRSAQYRSPLVEEELDIETLNSSGTLRGRGTKEG